MEPVPQLGTTGESGSQGSSGVHAADRTPGPGRSSSAGLSSDSPPQDTQSTQSSEASSSSEQDPETSSSGSEAPDDSSAAPRCQDKGSDYLCARRPDPDWKGPIALLQASTAQALSTCDPFDREVELLRDRDEASGSESPFFRGCAIAREGSCPPGRICTLKGLGVTCIYRQDEHECPFFFSVTRYLLRPVQEARWIDAGADWQKKDSVFTICCQSGKGEESRMPILSGDQSRPAPH